MDTLFKLSRSRALILLIRQDHSFVNFQEFSEPVDSIQAQWFVNLVRSSGNTRGQWLIFRDHPGLYWPVISHVSFGVIVESECEAELGTIFRVVPFSFMIYWNYVDLGAILKDSKVDLSPSCQRSTKLHNDCCATRCHAHQVLIVSLILGLVVRWSDFMLEL